MAYVKGEADPPGDPGIPGQEGDPVSELATKSECRLIGFFYCDFVGTSRITWRTRATRIDWTPSMNL